MAHINADDVHEQNVTMSLHLNRRVENLALISVMVFVVGMVGLIITANVLREYFSVQMPPILPVVILGVVAAVTAFPFVKAFKIARAFDEEHVQAHQGWATAYPSGLT